MTATFLPLEWGAHDSQVLDLWLQFSWIGVFCSSSPRMGTKTEKIHGKTQPSVMLSCDGSHLGFLRACSPRKNSHSLAVHFPPRACDSLPAWEVRGHPKPQNRAASCPCTHLEISLWLQGDFKVSQTQVDKPAYFTAHPWW